MSDSIKTTKKQSLVIKKLLEDIQTGDATKIAAALKLLQVNGDITVLRPLAELLMTDIVETSKYEIISFLGDLKVSAAADEIMDLIKDEQLLPVRQALLTSIWNSKVDYSYFIADFVEIACEGDFMEALECFTT